MPVTTVTTKKKSNNPVYSEAICDKVIELIEAGCYETTAAHAIGVTSQCIANWKTRHPEFGARCEAAHAKAEAWHIANIKRHSDTTWQASAWMLERRHHQKWGRVERNKVEVSVDEGLADQILEARKRAKEPKPFDPMEANPDANE